MQGVGMRYNWGMVKSSSKSESGASSGSERVIYDDRPHPVYIVTETWRWIVFGVLLWGVMIWVDGRLPGYGLSYWGWGVLVIVLIRVIVAAIDRIVRVHRLTDSKVITQFGILRTVRTDMTHDRVQHLVVVRTLVERLFGIGSVGISSAGTGAVEMVWRGVERPERIREMIQSVVSGTGSGSGGGPGAGSGEGQTMKKTPVIGLVGGIGSGKSTVARSFVELGCVVSDSDKSGLEALTRPEIIKELVGWWGDEILGDSGQVDRKKVAGIVFRDPEQRKRLEGLVHPLIHAERHELIEKSRGNDEIRAVIVDAPLLFEAGVDGECDAVVFVQTPKRIRVQRVQETRGWDEEELDRREKAQLGLEQKRERADYIIANGGSVDELMPQVVRTLEAIEESMMGSDGS